MPKVIINNHEYEAAEGELLLDVARRNAEHIGFICNGQAWCTSCECKVVSGADQLSPISRGETDTLYEERLRRGHRLACQAAIDGEGKEGTLEVVTRVEELKRQFNATFDPRPGETMLDNLSKFVTNLTEITWEHVIIAPSYWVNTLQRLGPVKFVVPQIDDFGRWVRDGQRVIDRQLRDRDNGNGFGYGSDDKGIPPASATKVVVEVEEVEV